MDRRYQMFGCVEVILPQLLLKFRSQEFDFTNQFWAQVQISGGGPPARWGAVGGIDIRTAPIQDPIIAGPNNTLYLVGGADDSEVFSLSDVWRLNISGALSSNLVNDTSGSWDRVSSGNLPSRTGAGGTVLHQQVIAVGGCGSSSGNESCIKQDSYILNLADDTELSPAGCPVPRSNPVVVTNTNTFSTSFSSQIFLLLGTFDDSLWSDGGNLAKGEVVGYVNMQPFSTVPIITVGGPRHKYVDLE